MKGAAITILILIILLGAAYFYVKSVTAPYTKVINTMNRAGQ